MEKSHTCLPIDGNLVRHDRDLVVFGDDLGRERVGQPSLFLAGATHVQELFVSHVEMPTGTKGTNRILKRVCAWRRDYRPHAAVKREVLSTCVSGALALPCPVDGHGGASAVKGKCTHTLMNALMLNMAMSQKSHFESSR